MNRPITGLQRQLRHKTSTCVKISAQLLVDSSGIIALDLHLNLNPIMAGFLAIWTCLVPVFATANDCTDAFERISGLHPGTSVEIECSTERESIYKGTGTCVQHNIQNKMYVQSHWIRNRFVRAL